MTLTSIMILMIFAIAAGKNASEFRLKQIGIVVFFALVQLAIILTDVFFRQPPH